MRSRGATSAAAGSPDASVARPSRSAANRRARYRAGGGDSVVMQATPWRRTRGLQLVGALGQGVGQVHRDLGGLVLVHAVFGDQLRQHRAVDAAGDVVARGDGKEGAGVVVEADGVVE